MPVEIDEQRFVGALAVAGAFAALGRMLATPLETDQVEALRDGESLLHFGEYLEALGVDASDQLQRMRNVLSAAELESVSQRLNIEATRLFHVHLPEPPAIPYESVWREPERLAMGRSAVAVAAVYRESGIAPRETFADQAPDHIARELEFVAAAARSEASALQDGDAERAERWARVRGDFLSEHVQRWVPEFLQAVVADGRSEFFRAVAEVGIGVLAATAAESPAQS